jgi:hypothetical protein
MNHHFCNIGYLEKPSQWLSGWENYQKNKAHDALNSFYVLKLLPSFASDVNDKEDGLNNFYGKLVIFSESHDKINDLSIKKNLDTGSYDFGLNVWHKFWPNNVTQGVIPKWLRVMYLDSFKSHDYPISISRDVCK